MMDDNVAATDQNEETESITEDEEDVFLYMIGEM